MQAVVAVAIGGGLGSALRYVISSPINERWPAAGTTAVNVVGSLLLGLLAGWYSARDGSDVLRLALGVGLLGGFTTFSTWMAESVDVIDRPGRLAVTVVVPVALGLTAGWVGLRVGRAL